MLKSITMRNVATYDNVGVTLNNLNRVNLIFGPNGTGKTTISNYLSHYSKNKSTGESIPSQFSECYVDWDSETDNEILVYNRAFKKENIGKTHIPGVFVMGKRAVDNRAKIQSLQDELLTIQHEINDFNKSITDLESSYQYGGSIYKTWLESVDNNLTKDANALYPKILDGLKRDHNKRILKILEIYEKVNPSTILTEDEIKRNIGIINEKTAEVLRELPTPDFTGITSIEASKIWEKVIVGSGDIDFAGFINSLNLSDWVRQGVEKINSTNGICPFCQQHTITADIVTKFNDYFDEEYKNDIKMVEGFVDRYKTTSYSLIGSLKNLISEKSYAEFIDSERLHKIIDDLVNHLEANLMLMANKVNTPSDQISIRDGSMLYEVIEGFIGKININIIKRNSLITQKNQLKNRLPDNVWNFLIDKYRKGIELYYQNRDNNTNQISQIKDELENRSKEEASIKKQISDLRAQSSDCTAVVERINKTLERLQFNSFKIESHGSSSYRIVRQNGESASPTLSEGEETLISFLYYIHLLNGSINANKAKGNVIAVIDDPISSLDNSILSFVAREIKNLMFNSGDYRKNIRQVIVLTHNINFHKSLAKSPIAYDNNKTKKTFYILDKDLCKHTTFLKSQEFKDNIESEYNELWRLLKKAYEKISSNNNEDDNKDYKYTIQNTMRRIYETFFSNTCHLLDNEIALRFENEADDFRNFVEWLNEGSHSANLDDYKGLPSDDVIHKYMEIFKKTFIVTGNYGQYEMLMKC